MFSAKRWILCAPFLALAMLTVAGCYKESPKSDTGKKPDTKKEHGHDHPEAGPHEGALVEWGEEEYHVEFKVDHGKKEATVYILDGTGKKAPAVGAKITDVKLSLTNVQPPVTIDLKPDAQKSGDKGIAFVGTHEQLGKEMEFKGNVSGKVAGKDYSGDFEEKEHDHKAEKK